MGAGSGGGDIFFVPQRPYVVLGTLREQLLYPTWADADEHEDVAAAAASVSNSDRLVCSRILSHLGSCRYVVVTPELVF